MSKLLTIHENQLPERLHDEAIGDDGAMERFEDHLQSVAEMAPEGIGGDEERAIVYAVEELARNADDADSDEMTDATDDSSEELSNGGFDLRTETDI